MFKRSEGRSAGDRQRLWRGSTPFHALRHAPGVVAKYLAAGMEFFRLAVSWIAI
jgi:hypothetical protein